MANEKQFNQPDLLSSPLPLVWSWCLTALSTAKTLLSSLLPRRLGIVPLPAPPPSEEGWANASVSDSETLTEELKSGSRPKVQASSSLRRAEPSELPPWQQYAEVALQTCAEQSTEDAPGQRSPARGWPDFPLV